MSRPRVVGLQLALCLSVAAIVRAQTPDAKLTVTVVDPTGGVLPTATVTLTGQDPATQQAVMNPVAASDKGIAVFEHLVPGLYSLEAEFTQFNPTIVKDVRLKSGDNTRTVVLTLKQLTESVTVIEDKQVAASDRSSVSFGSALTKEQIQALSDDPTELLRQIQAMAGPDAVIRVDGFEGAPLPPKAQIKSIHIVRDSFAAESHYAGATFVDIVTQPGVGTPHGTISGNEENWNLDGRNPLLPSKTPMNAEFTNWLYGQSLAKDRADFTATFNQRDSYTAPAIYAASPTGTVAQVLDIHAPTNLLAGTVNFNYALTPDQALKIWVQGNRSTSEDNGVGGMNTLDRAYSTTSSQDSFRLLESGPLGRRFFINTRIQVLSSSTSDTAALDAPTIAVPGAFTSGGAQLAGGTQQRAALVQSDVDYIRGINSFRFGTQRQGTWYHTNADTNYLGTYSYPSLAAYEANTPALFTQNIGAPTIGYTYFEGGVYLQDDIRVRKSLTISPGVRYEIQNHSTDHHNVAPRIGFTWAPFKSGVTTLRASAGIFYDWISNGTYEASLRDDGIHQQQLNIVDPVFGDVSATEGSIPATGVDLLGPNLQLARTLRFSAAIRQGLSKQATLSAVYAHNRSIHQLSGVNLNAPVDGVVPDSAFTTVIQAQSDASTLSDSIQTTLSIDFAPPSPGLNSAPFNWRRGGVVVNYTYAHVYTDALGAFIPSPTGTLATEWGPAANDIPHSLNVIVSSDALKGLNVTLFLVAHSGAPYTETTSVDDLSDFLFDLRPAGVGRNSLRMPAPWDLTLTTSYTTQTRAPDPNRFHLSLGLYAVNLTNHANYSGYSGIIGSPFFMQPTAVGHMRSVEFVMTFRY
jgi:hypothetical protein